MFLLITIASLLAIYRRWMWLLLLALCAIIPVKADNTCQPIEGACIGSVRSGREHTIADALPGVSTTFPPNTKWELMAAVTLYHVARVLPFCIMYRESLFTRATIFYYSALYILIYHLLAWLHVLFFFASMRHPTFHPWHHSKALPNKDKASVFFLFILQAATLFVQDEERQQVLQMLLLPICELFVFFRLITNGLFHDLGALPKRVNGYL